MKSFYTSVLLVSASLLNAQDIDFSAYDRIEDSEFARFVSLFPRKELPISTDEIVSTINIWSLNRRPLSQGAINQFLIDEGELILGPLYTEEPDEGLSSVNIDGSFYPLFKLPTNGDYVMLVVAQVDDVRQAECAARVVVINYDLTGKFIYLSSYLYDPGTIQINAFIDENLRSQYSNAYYEVEGEGVFPPINDTFSAEEVHVIYQIQSNGRSSKVSVERTLGQFRFNPNECRFNKVE